jgi:AraC-like DNA-binding protein
MSSQQRKQAVHSILKHGQLKQLASDLKMSYSYLSQAFSLTTSISFNADLARKVEQALGLTSGQLDLGEHSVGQNLASSGLFALALRGRAAELVHHYPDKRIELNATITVACRVKHADLIIYNNDGTAFLIAEQTNEFEDDDKTEQLIMLMAIAGAQFGVVFAADSGIDANERQYVFTREAKRSRWYQSQHGKIASIEEGPDKIFSVAGI